MKQNKKSNHPNPVHKAHELEEEEKGAIASVYYTVKEKSEELFEDVRDSAENLYKEGKNKVNDLEEVVSDYAEDLIKIVKKKPVSSILIAGLIAGGIGYIIVKMLKNDEE